MIDLHTHSSASDGELQPEELIREAHARGLSAVALTDHDGTAGIAPALAAGAALGITVIGGVELSTDPPWSGSAHLLGYGVDPDDGALIGLLDRMCRGRERRLVAMVEKLGELGVPVAADAIRARAAGEAIGRPQIAKEIVARGHATDVPEAFLRFLRYGAPAYVQRDRLPLEEAIRVLREAGGAAVLAHPGSLRISVDELAGYLPRLCDAGLQGLEVSHPDHDEAQMAGLSALARAHGLIATGGSDFHGPGVKPDAQLGHGTGGRPIDDALLEGLAEILGLR